MALLTGIPDTVAALAILGFLLIGAKLGEEAFRRLGLIPFVGAIVVGVVVGPGLLGLVPNPNLDPSKVISLFLELGINFLLFVSGAQEFEATRIRSMLRNRKTLGLGLVEFVVRFASLTVVAYLLFGDLVPALVVGTAAGMSSAGPLSRLLTDTGLARTHEGTAIFSQVVVIEIAAVVLFSFVYSLAGRAITWVSVATVAVEVTLTVGGVILFGRYVLVPLLEKVESHFRSRESVFAVVVALVLVTGFAGQVTGFNAAIVALFLGLLLQDFFATRPVLMEKFHAFTYGFFEPLFFVGLGLYFVPMTPTLLFMGVVIFAAALAIGTVVGAAAARSFGVEPWKNAFGTGVKGGVDSALLVSALTASVVLVSGYAFSVAAIGIALLSLMAPLLFRLRAPPVPLDHGSGVRKIVRQELDALTADEISKTLPSVVVRDTDSVRDAVRKCVELDARAASIVNARDRPVGTLIVREAMALSPREMGKLRVRDMDYAMPLKVSGTVSALALARLFRETNIPIVAVVDAEGKLVGTVLEREILRRMVQSFDS
jgi:Kef-type K+ transport system membrane component KefB/CBS domain-containing protein